MLQVILSPASGASFALRHPTFRDVLERLLRVLAEAPDGLASRRAQDLVADRLQLSTAEREQPCARRHAVALQAPNELGTRSLEACAALVDATRGVWKLTPKGIALVGAHATVPSCTSWPKPAGRFGSQPCYPSWFGRDRCAQCPAMHGTANARDWSVEVKVRAAVPDDDLPLDRIPMEVDAHRLRCRVLHADLQVRVHLDRPTTTREGAPSQPVPVGSFFVALNSFFPDTLRASLSPLVGNNEACVRRNLIRPASAARCLAVVSRTTSRASIDRVPSLFGDETAPACRLAREHSILCRELQPVSDQSCAARAVMPSGASARTRRSGSQSSRETMGKPWRPRGSGYVTSDVGQVGVELIAAPDLGRRPITPKPLRSLA